MVTEYAVVVVLQPVAFTESLTIKVPVPAEPQAMVALADPCPDDIVPPVTVQAYVLPVFVGIV